MRTQSLTSQRTYECEISGLARERGQPTNIGEPVQSPESDQVRHGCDFVRYLHTNVSLSNSCYCFALKAGAKLRALALRSRVFQTLQSGWTVRLPLRQREDQSLQFRTRLGMVLHELARGKDAAKLTRKLAWLRAINRILCTTHREQLTLHRRGLAHQRHSDRRHCHAA